MNPKTFFRLTLLLVLILALPGATALADSPAPVNWTAHYYSNPGLSGEPAKTVTETAIDYDWGFNAPADGLPADNFSVRWTGSATFEAGDYTFSVTVDDGARVWLDGDLLIDEWRRQAPTTFTAQTRLSAGTHQIQMAYFEATGTAVAKLWWRFDAPAPDTGPAPTEPPASIDWQVEYFNNPSLLGAPTATGQVSAIDYDWGFNAPVDGLPADNFSVRWTGSAAFGAGDYTFSVTADDGVRVWLDDQMLIDEWREQAATTFTASTHLGAGTHQIKVAHYEATGAAVIKFWWRQDAANGVTPTPTPSAPSAQKLLIDNLDEAFTWGGPTRYRYTGGGAFGNSFYWTGNTSFFPVNYGKWTPTFSARGKYRVWAFIPKTFATSGQVRYRILHNGERHDAIINQAIYHDEWVSLGTYTFKGDNQGKEFILVYDNTHESANTAAIAFDAVKLELDP